MKPMIPLMTVVERAVRPLPASTPRKRKIREELLAHVTAIYDEEHARLNDPAAAVRETERRFGNSAALARELEKVLPSSERWAYVLERWCGWRAPESAARYTRRVALQLFVLFAVPFVLSAIPLALAVKGESWNSEAWRALRSAAAFVVFLPIAQFVLGLLYFKMRDALWGAFGARASCLRVLGYAALIALLVYLGLLGFVMFATWNLTMAAGLLTPGGLVALACAVGYVLGARFRGPVEICDTHWACLELEPRAAGNLAPPAGNESSLEPT